MDDMEKHETRNDHRLKTNLHIIRNVIVDRTLQKYRAYPWSMLFENVINAILSVMLPLFIYYFIYHGNVSDSFVSYANTSDYVSYLIAGQMMGVFVFSSLMSTGYAILSDIHEGTFNHFLISPSSTMLFFIGAFIETLLQAIGQALVIWLFGLLLGVRGLLLSPGALLVVFVLLIISGFSVSIFLSTWIIYFKDTYLTESTLSLFISLFSGIFFPPAYMPGVLRSISYVMPVTYLIKLFRALAIEKASLAESAYLIWPIILLSLFYFVIGYFWYERKVRKILVEKVLM